MINLWKIIVTIIMIVFMGQGMILNPNILSMEESVDSSDISAVGMQGITCKEGQIFPVTGDYYVYAPSVIKEGNRYNVFYCSNADAGEIKDSIYYRQCVNTGNGFVYSESVQVLSAGKGWDSMHVCDPSVTRGDFVYQNNSYKYLMAYLGCSSKDNQDNKIGFALSNNCENWVKVENLCIAEEFDAQSDAFQWGVGQPSVLMMDGRLLLFYTSGSANLTCEKIKVYESGNFDQLREEATLVINNMQGDFISNADYAWNGSQLLMVCDRHPFSDGTLKDVSDASDIYVTDLSSYEDLFDCEWKYVEAIDSDVTGYDKNHNACLVKDWSGNYQSEAVVTVATQKKRYLKSLWTYTLYFIQYL